jgi:hypothetical protein
MEAFSPKHLPILPKVDIAFIFNTLQTPKIGNLPNPPAYAPKNLPIWPLVEKTLAR